MLELVSRRHILKTGGTISAGIVASPFLNMHGLLNSIAAQASETPPNLPDPSVTGTYSQNVIENLYSIATYPATKWNVSGESAFDINEFTEIINLKTQQTPSYFTAYQQTINLFFALKNTLGSTTAALDYLYTPNPNTPPVNWDTARFWAIQEFLIIFITSGNFRSYGWVNYPGWMGGPFNNPKDLPYRGMTDG